MSFFLGFAASLRCDVGHLFIQRIPFGGPGRPVGLLHRTVRVADQQDRGGGIVLRDTQQLLKEFAEDYRRMAE